MISNRIRIFLLLVFYSVAAHSQNMDLNFNHLTTDDGLSQSNVTCILQDSKGFMWFGTFNGLNRYDGYAFDVFHYQPNDIHSVSHNYISALFEDHSGYLWVGTSDGLNRYDRKTNRFKSYKHHDGDPTSISDSQIESIFQDSKDRLWIGTRNGGLALFSPRTESFTHFFHDENDKKSLSTNFIRFIFEDSAGNLWIAHGSGAIDIFHESRNDFEQLLINEEKLTDFRISAIAESPNKNIWIGTQGDGLYRLDYAEDTALRVEHFSTNSPEKNRINSNTVLCLIIDRQQKLWIGTEDKGINILDTQTQSIQYCHNDPFDQSSLNHDSVWSIYEDRAGNIWIGTYAYGINLLTRRKAYFQHYKYHPGSDNCVSHDMVNAFLEDKKNNIWIATDGGGLNLFERRNDRFIHYTSENSHIRTNVIVSLFEDSRGRLWLGTWADGLYQFDRVTKKVRQYTQEEHGLGSNRILQICEDRDGGLWLCTFWGGITYFNSSDGTVVVYNKNNSDLSDNDVRDLIQDMNGNLWIGTDVGLDYFNPQTKTFINYRHSAPDENSLSKGFVHTVIQTRDSTIWIGTTGGLNKLAPKTHKFVHYNTSHGLPDNEIKCIIEEKDGALWLSTNKGISRFDVKSETFKNYDVTDGLQGNDFNARSGIKTARGEIVFGGNNGFNIFQPDEINDNLYLPPVIITNFKIFNKQVPIGGEDSPLHKQISETQNLTLSYHDAVFSFEYVALNYSSPEKNQYAYKMNDFETDWNYVKSKRSATYTNLDPGDYVFTVKASNNDGIWNEEGVSLNITIDPPFWKTWWAYLIEALLVASVLSFVLNYFISRHQLRNKLKMEHLELEKMYELDQMKTHFFSNISHEFHSPLTLIMGPLEKLIATQKSDDKIKNGLMLIYQNAQRLQRMTNQLKNIQKIETGDLHLSLSRGNIISFIAGIVSSFQDYARERHISFEFEAEPDSVFAWFDTDKLDKIIYNLLSNAFKFTPLGGRIVVAVSLHTAEKKDKDVRCIEIRVQDSGIGIPEAEIEHIFKRFYQIDAKNGDGKTYTGSGVGLAFVYELVELYGGKISVSSKAGNGANFTVQIPIDEQYLEVHQLVGEYNMLPLNPVVQPGEALTIDVAETGNHIKNSRVKDIPIILIVEDDKEIRNYIQNLLAGQYRVFSAENGRKGFEKALKIIPDLIICDIKMPFVSGTQLCKNVKQNEKTSHIPMILLTAYSAAEQKAEGLLQGADAYLTKPFRIDILEAQIANLLESRKKLKAKYSREIYLGPQRVALQDIDEKFLQRVVKTIEVHISDDKFNAQILSENLGMSRMQLYRKIRGLTDQTVHEFIRSIRLKRAVQLLEQKRMTITEVAYEVGFNDLTYFARCFRKQYQKSPSEYFSK